jgi:hypothetical protein
MVASASDANKRGPRGLLSRMPIARISPSVVFWGRVMASQHFQSWCVVANPPTEGSLFKPSWGSN